jgi:CelD/BcsL family acetyltransferase involved in cellulose biosynthesis
MFIGQDGDVTPEYLDFFVEREREPEVVPALCDYLAGKLRWRWDHVVLEKTLRSSPCLPHIDLTLRRRGVRLNEVAEAACPYAELPDTWDGYLKSRSKHFRKRVRYRERQLASAGEVRYLRAGEDIPLEQAFNLLVRLNRVRWAEAGESFRSDAYTRFHWELCHRILPLGWLVLVLLTVDGEVVAAEYDFAYGSKVYGNQSGWLPEWAEQEPSAALQDWMLRWSIENGYREYDFMAVETPFKRKWAKSTRMMVELEGSARTPGGIAFDRSRRIMRLARRHLRRYLPRRLVERI